MNVAKAEILRATMEDIPAIAPLFDAYRGFFAGSTDSAESLRFLRERFTHGDSVIFLARIEKEVAGFVQLYPLWSSWYCRRIWFLSDLYVDESTRNRGLGRRLVERTIAYAKETDAMSIIVELPRREPHLTKFYADLGFAADEVFDLARYRLG